jgi:hypothetical protein
VRSWKNAPHLWLHTGTWLPESHWEANKGKSSQHHLTAKMVYGM